MEIRKEFTFNGMHIVRKCSSNRCKKSIHSHTYKVEVFLESETLDTGVMVYDFGLMKGTIKDFIKSFDNSWSVWDIESKEYKQLVEQYDRYIYMPISPSAEGYSLLFLFVISKILNNTKFNNNEGDISVSRVRVHETESGFAESRFNDIVLFDLNLIKFSNNIIDSWSDKEMWNKLIDKIPFVNPIN